MTGGKRILKHAHAFFAVYFTFGVSFLATESGLRKLPGSAIVIVPPKSIHGWEATAEKALAIVGHFHKGHAAHLTESLADHAA